MRPIISFVGRSGSGKTTLLEKVVAELSRRGHRIMVIKHSDKDYELDTANKDSWRFSQAGSSISAFSAAHKLALYRRDDHDFTPEELALFVAWDYDFILTEGFKRLSYPKIEVLGPEQAPELVSPREHLLAVVSDSPLPLDLPRFSREDFTGVADLVEKAVSARRQRVEVDLVINSQPVPLSPHLQDLLDRTLAAALSGLKKDQALKSLRLFLRRET